MTASRRDFLLSLAAAPLAAQAGRERATAPASPIIDALGETHLEYDDVLLAETIG